VIGVISRPQRACTLVEMRRGTGSALPWQIGGGIVALLFILGFIGELVWWPLFLSDRSNVNRPFTIGVHVLGVVAIGALVLYLRLRKKFDAALARVRSRPIESFGFRMSILSFPTHVQWLFFSMAFMLSIGETFRGFLLRLGLIVVGVIAHELGHAVAARKMGFENVQIALHALGGYTTYGGWARRAQEIAVALAGPAVGVFLGLITITMGERWPAFHRTIGYSESLFVTLGWSLLNLLPILPLDGGVVFSKLMRNEATAQYFSFFFATGGAIAAAYLHQIGVVIFLSILAITNFLALPMVATTITRLNRRFG
jgi:Zn-dependent protease